MKWIGLTGGIGTGKSTASGILRDLGAAVIDADVLAREAVASDTAIGSATLVEVVREFGPGVRKPDGSLDRKALGALVFGRPQRLRRLEEILHPVIQARCAELREGLARQGRALAFYDVPLLFEKNMEPQFESTVAVLCAPSTQRERLIARDGLTGREADVRIAAQLPLAEKAKRATVVVMNDGSVEELRSKLRTLSEKLTGLPRPHQSKT